MAKNTISRASILLKNIKKEYQKELQSNIRKGTAITASAKKAGKTYRDKYGATPTTRWHNALKQASATTAKKSTKKVVKIAMPKPKKATKTAAKTILAPQKVKKTTKRAVKTATKPILPKVAKPKKIAVKKEVKVAPKIAPAPKTTLKPKISPAPIVAVAQKITAPKATKTAKSNVKFDIEKYVSTDELRPVMNCVYYDNDDKVAVATDAHILIYSKELYNPKYAGKMIAARDIWKGKGMKNARIEYAKGAIVEGKYPNWKAIMPKNTLSFKINTQKMYDFCIECENYIKNGVKKINAEIDQRLKNGEPKNKVGGHITAKDSVELARIYISHNDTLLESFNLLKFKKFLNAMIFLGADIIYFDKEWTNTKPILSYNKNGGVVLMPLMNELTDKNLLTDDKWKKHREFGKREYGYGVDEFEMFFRYNI